MTETITHWLVPIAGPALDPLPLAGKRGMSGLILGRHESSDLLMPATADTVSRQHARFDFRDGRWEITDLSSRWGTHVNGHKLLADETISLRNGDLIHVEPWTFSLSTSPVGRGLKLPADGDSMGTIVNAPGGTIAEGPLSVDLLSLLLESATGIHHAADLNELAAVLLEAAARGTGLANGTLLRPLDAHGTFEVIAARLPAHAGDSAPNFSRTLIEAASRGDIAQFSASIARGQDVAQSIIAMNVVNALCIPLMLGNSAAAYLYLDSRGQQSRAAVLQRQAADFCAALGRIASLALANLKRIEMERRAASVEAELRAGAEAQRFILPARVGSVGRFSYIGESKPGRYVGGDFFDIIPLDEHRIAVALADVAGKGIPASVLMTAAQGYLHSALERHLDLAAAVRALNQFICPRCPSNKFLTLFVAVLDSRQNTLTCVDAGHGYGLMRASPVALFAPVPVESSLPVGITADLDYPATTVSFPPGSELLIVSDGIIEQPGTSLAANPALAQSTRQQFDVEGVQSTLAAPTADPITTLFLALEKFANSSTLADDATAVLVRHEP